MKTKTVAVAVLKSANTVASWAVFLVHIESAIGLIIITSDSNNLQG